MKNTFLFLLFVASSTVLYAQTVAVQCDKMNILYVGIDNPLTIAVEGYSCENIVVTTDNGRISGEKGQYIAIPEHKGQAVIIVSIKTQNGAKKVAEMPMRVKCIEITHAYLLGKRDGFISTGLVHEAIAPQVPIEGYDIDAKCIIFHIKVIVIRDNEQIMDRSITKESGIRFNDDPQVVAMIKSLKRGDKLIIDDIKIRGPFGSACYGPIQPINLTIN